MTVPRSASIAAPSAVGGQSAGGSHLSLRTYRIVLTSGKVETLVREPRDMLHKDHGLLVVGPRRRRFIPWVQILEIEESW